MSEEIDMAALERDIAKTGRRLDQLAEKVQKKILRKSSRAAAAPFVKGLRDNSPQDEKDLSRTMGVSVSTDTRIGAVIAMAGQSNAKRKRRKAVHIHRVDQPTKPHIITGAQFRSRATGELVKGNFWHPGTDGADFVDKTARQKQGEAMRIFEQKTSQEIDAEVSRMA